MTGYFTLPVLLKFDSPANRQEAVGAPRMGAWATTGLNRRRSAQVIFDASAAFEIWPNLLILPLRKSDLGHLGI